MPRLGARDGSGSDQEDGDQTNVFFYNGAGAGTRSKRMGGSVYNGAGARLLLQRLGGSG